VFCIVEFSIIFIEAVQAGIKAYKETQLEPGAIASEPSQKDFIQQYVLDNRTQMLLFDRTLTCNRARTFCGEQVQSVFVTRNDRVPEELTQNTEYNQIVCLP
jgi:hypothetical protein